jgi:hypothetical protein
LVIGAIEQQLSNLHTIQQGQNARIQEEVKKYAETGTF